MANTKMEHPKPNTEDDKYLCYTEIGASTPSATPDVYDSTSNAGKQNLNNYDVLDSGTCNCEVKGHQFTIATVDLQKLDAKNDLFLDKRATEYYVCGPEGFMATKLTSLVERVVDPSRVKMVRRCPTCAGYE
ncbi:hypothetical protein V1525DRAFT_417867 [Lipomyces kononenkoae]|uniref:Uncharacterized protein n=1 Tax=Lipomyces kononenkoae TaxID=34357 RepID=A0ACC3T631_LIPKO